MNLLNNMQRKFGKYAIPNLMRYVIALYILGYAIQYIMPEFARYLTLEPYLIFHGGQVWRLISWVLIPPSRTNIIFVAIMLVLYYQLGTALESYWGTFRFNLYIFGGVIFNIIAAMILFVILGVNTPISIGGGFTTYYINLTIFLAFAVSFPDMQILLYFLIPIKMKWMAIVYGIMVGLDFFGSSLSVKAAIIAAAVNFIIFFFTTKNMSSFNPKQVYRRQVYKKQVSEPKNATKHKCAICGRTELDDPSLVFRFCSKCNGNHEYCNDHLFTHTHIM